MKTSSSLSVGDSVLAAKAEVGPSVVVAAGQAAAAVTGRAVPVATELANSPPIVGADSAASTMGAEGGAVADDAPMLLEAFAAVSLDEATSMSLSPPQRLAIQMLTSGQTLVAAATAAGVNRTTLYRWLKADPAFQAAYNAWQKDVRDTARGRILALSDLAINTIAKAMSQGDAKAALKILEATGALKIQEPGSTDPTEISRLQKLEQTKTQTALRRAETRAAMDAELPM